MDIIKARGAPRRGRSLLNAVLKKISEHVDTDHNVTVNQNGDWSNIGVVVKGNNEQSYIGVSIRIKNVNK